MGTYTFLQMDVELDLDKMPKKYYHILLDMTDTSNTKFNDRVRESDINHQLFSTSRWSSMLHNGGFEEHYSRLEGSELSIKCEFKNYDNELEKFVDWLFPYIVCKEDDKIAYRKYEEFDNIDYAIVTSDGHEWVNTYKPEQDSYF